MRAFGPGSSEPGVASDKEWPAGAWGDPVHEQPPPKGGLSPVTEYDPVDFGFSTRVCEHDSSADDTIRVMSR